MYIFPASDGTREQGVVLRETNDPDSRFTNKAQRCHEHVKKNSPGANPYAICTASMGYGESYRKRSQRKAKEAAEPVRIVTGPLVEMNTCHSKQDGKFCSGPGVEPARGGRYMDQEITFRGKTMKRGEAMAALQDEGKPIHVINKLTHRGEHTFDTHGLSMADSARFATSAGGGDSRADGRDNYRGTYKSASKAQVDAEWMRGSRAARDRIAAKQGKTVSAATSNSAAMRGLNQGLADEIRAYVKRGAMSQKDGAKAIKTLAKGGAARDRLVNQLLPNFRRMHGSAR